MNMTEPMFLALTALVDEPRHGYGIVQEVERLSEGKVQLKIGTLYGVLDRLAAEGLVELDREEVQSGRLRRYYRLTDSGEHALQSEVSRLAGTLQTATERLSARRGAVAVRPSIAGGAA
ncbi:MULTISPECIES: PadR family transcriptional regulator [Nonomuraea]|uniref:DNA-binding PadR family transcriptional regulator n=3 Tax=Nonomuraea TaxID=83681 RepID=A0A7W5VGZ2_9ACTN|nr:PadR family transcriptional regulator [Nonomuraea dietziae]MBB3731359.1 DNA-binding PadR family transcriptional regulator [Nonomuraea dietziae]